MKLKELNNVTLIGLGLLGGSLGLSIARSMHNVKRIGYSHRETTRTKAISAGIVDSITTNLADSVANAQLIILCSPIGTFKTILTEIKDRLQPGAIITDVGSTKVLPNNWAKKYLPKDVTFIGSHPMAGSEQRGLDFSRADLFDHAPCIITPNKTSPSKDILLLKRFWEEIGMRVSTMTPLQHDKVLAQISHMPHALAVALINSTPKDQALLCGKGFLDTSRVASGDESVWGDIFMSNAKNTDQAIGRLINELTRIQKALKSPDHKQINNLLCKAKDKRNNLVNQKIRRKELPL